MVASVDMVWPKRVLVDGDILSNKYWVGLVKVYE